jgi:parallel beta-helix repeat protein
MPTPASIVGKPKVGQIVAKSGQVIENVHITTTSGPCVVLTNVSNVTIRNSEIGPCGSPGNANSHGIVTIGASNITIRSNVIHDVSTGAYITDSTHPVVFEKNYVYNIRGPFPRGQMIQTNGLKGGSGSSRITCNVSDAQPGTRYGVSHDLHNVEDHINLYETLGSSSARVEIAYNRIRGGHPTSSSGSGIMAGDGQVGSGWIWAHNNVVTNVRNVGMAIAGGSNNTLENNRIYQNAAVIPINVGLYTNNYSASACANAALLNNRVWTSNNNPMWNSGSCATTVRGQNLSDTSLDASMFDEIPAACEDDE